MPLVLSAVVGAALAVGPATTADAGPRVFKNCTEMHKTYKHGVGKPGARDRTSGTPVTTFKRSKKIYTANRKSDRDKDGIACEKR
ncbi:excalibur calcium-binding domain-containing protein [Aeromicrobium sp. IC_218]|uniref:excalibur calcium-binding domain-containing protein n=1 Tax=Aeromicrobium sp. IC_218 TaxID=2545468 RepID=UPI00103D772A|nr:excalibur calcium-binding domain-containing protein [Aeromicrobium sp. IC_218]TCJ00405.1 excalibur calcium-binding domain-containing protein [Aeromicrobium sp. IC_218]